MHSDYDWRAFEAQESAENVVGPRTLKSVAGVVVVDLGNDVRRNLQSSSVELRTVTSSDAMRIDRVARPPPKHAGLSTCSTGGEICLHRSCTPGAVTI